MVLACRGTRLTRGGELRVLGVGDGREDARATLDVHGVARGLRERDAAGRSAALRGSSGAGKRGGGLALGRRGAARSAAVSVGRPWRAAGTGACKEGAGVLRCRCLCLREQESEGERGGTARVTTASTPPPSTVPTTATCARRPVPWRRPQSVRRNA